MALALSSDSVAAQWLRVVADDLPPAELGACEQEIERTARYIADAKEEYRRHRALLTDVESKGRQAARNVRALTEQRQRTCLTKRAERAAGVEKRLKGNQKHLEEEQAKAQAALSGKADLADRHLKHAAKQREAKAKIKHEKEARKLERVSASKEAQELAKRRQRQDIERDACDWKNAYEEFVQYRRGEMSRRQQELAVRRADVKAAAEERFEEHIQYLRRQTEESDERRQARQLEKRLAKQKSEEETATQMRCQRIRILAAKGSQSGSFGCAERALQALREDLQTGSVKPQKKPQPVPTFVGPFSLQTKQILGQAAENSPSQSERSTSAGASTVEVHSSRSQSALKPSIAREGCKGKQRPRRVKSATSTRSGSVRHTRKVESPTKQK
eukprot:TRINITY_DN17002_c0_g2_i2.p1 TRINITY_DN17002_c0_g2~~TRINITY_DN17002_c0_g2_i2.p1  ORF type:complete len:412 (+),score=102.35 TRINITY_DN17002_c0_g2_i2:73-1236(+)